MCRLINPSKSEIGVVSKHILDKIISAIIRSTHINQWKNTSSVQSWFNKLENNEVLSFICFDVCDFYPSITEKLLSKALDFAGKYRPISSHEHDIILHAKSSILYSYAEPWGKKTSSNLFDITIGSYNGAESCELVGYYLLQKIKEKFGSICDSGLYRDDSLGLSKASPQQTECIKKDLCSIFSNYGLKITIEVNTKTINFLNVTLNLSNGKYMAYTRSRNIPIYVNKRSNHPPHIIENIPKSINKRLSEISMDEHLFKEAAPLSEGPRSQWIQSTPHI